MFGITLNQRFHLVVWVNADGLRFCWLPCEKTIKPQRRALKYARRIFTISVLAFPLPVVAAVSLVVDSSLAMRDKLQELIFLFLSFHCTLPLAPRSAFHVSNYKTIFMTFSCLGRIYLVFVAHLCRHLSLSFSSCPTLCSCIIKQVRVPRLDSHLMRFTSLFD